MGHAESDEKKTDQARSGVAEVAGAAPEDIGYDGYREEQCEGGTGAHDLPGDLNVDAADGEAAPGCPPERSVSHAFEKSLGVEEIGGEEQEEREQTSGCPDDESCGAADGRQIEQEG